MARIFPSPCPTNNGRTGISYSTLPVNSSLKNLRLNLSGFFLHVINYCTCSCQTNPNCNIYTTDILRDKLWQTLSLWSDSCVYLQRVFVNVDDSDTCICSQKKMKYSNTITTSQHFISKALTSLAAFSLQHWCRNNTKKKIFYEYLRIPTV